MSTFYRAWMYDEEDVRVADMSRRGTGTGLRIAVRDIEIRCSDTRCSQCRR